MASFCKQCSIAVFGEDYGDFKRTGKSRGKLKLGYGYVELCEDCGNAWVDDDGICSSTFCSKKHGT